LKAIATAARLTFEAEVDTTEFGICHCSECQTLTGSAFNTALPVSAAKFVLLTGQSKTYVLRRAAGKVYEDSAVIAVRQSTDIRYLIHQHFGLA
jgi:hypothetical protein